MGKPKSRSEELVSRVDISYRHGAHWAWVLFYHYSHQGPEVTLITANAEGIEVAKPPLKAVALTSAWLKAPHWLMI
ncbi:paraquat-inducible protein B [Escherichia coli]|uniref:Paraquat-inducible protein B n=1 Tax=Escherichia coli TaxID=562 RepID=A0A376VMT2_ECOLX|nr:paraquat-inducible protein B [Escherichia coli]